MGCEAESSCALAHRPEDTTSKVAEEVKVPENEGGPTCAPASEEKSASSDGGMPEQSHAGKLGYGPECECCPLRRHGADCLS